MYVCPEGSMLYMTFSCASSDPHNYNTSHSVCLRWCCALFCSALQWRHNKRDNVTNHQLHDWFLNRLFRRRSRKISKLRVTGFCEGIHLWPMNSPHKWPETRKMFPFDDVIIANIKSYGFTWSVFVHYAEFLFFWYVCTFPSIYCRS